MIQKVSRILLYILAGSIAIIVLLLLVLAFYLKTTSGQKQLSQYVTQYLSEKIKSPVKANISYGFPDWVVLENLLILDQQKDTLIFSKKARLDLDMMALLNNLVKLNQVNLDQTHININETNDRYNFQYIVDAFAGNPNDTTQSKITYQLNQLQLTKLSLKYRTKDITSNIVLNELKTGFDLLNPTNNQYFIKPLYITGLDIKAKIINSQKSDPTQIKTNSSLPDFRFSRISASQINYDIVYNSLNSTAQNLNLDLLANQVDLPHQKANFDHFTLDAELLSSKNVDASKKTNPKEINFNDLELRKVKIHSKNLLVDSFKDFKGQLNLLTFKEKSGFQVDKLFTDFSFQNNKLALNDLEVGTPSSNLNGSLFFNLDTIKTQNSKFTFELKKAEISPKETLFFSAALSQNKYFSPISKEKIEAKGSINGDFTQLKIDNFYASINSKTRLNLNGTIKNFDNPQFDINIKELISTKSEITRLLPKETIPTDTPLPANLSLTGNIKGNLKDLNGNIFLVTNEGTARIKLNLQDLNNTPKYKGDILLSQVNGGFFGNNKEIGKVNGYLNFTGTGFQNPKLNLSGQINEVNYQNKKYQNIIFDSFLDNKLLDTRLSINDETARINWAGKIDLTNPQIVIKGNTGVDYINLKALGLTDQNIEMKGDFIIHDLVADKINPVINIEGKNIMLYKDNLMYPADFLKVLTQNEGEFQTLSVQTEFMDLKVKGNFEYENIGKIVLTEINKYFKIPEFNVFTATKTYDINLDGKIDYNPIFTAFVPSLINFDKLNLKTRITSASSSLPVSGIISLGSMQFDSTKLSNFAFNFHGDGTTLDYSANLSEILQQSFRVRNAQLKGQLHDNVADFNLEVKDSTNTTVHALHGFVNSIDNKVRVSFDEVGSRLFYEPWSGNPYGYFEYSSKGIKFSDIIFTQNNQQIIRINSLNDEPNGPLSVFTRNIDLNFFSKAIFRDSNYVSGNLDIDLELVDYMDGSPTFSGDIEVQNLIYEGQKIGDLTGVANSISDEQIFVTAKINSDINQLELQGNVYPKKEENIDLTAAIKKLDAQTLQLFAVDILKEMKGGINGDFKITGSTFHPVINGKLEIEELQLRLVETNALLKIKNQAAVFENMNLNFKNFEINDINDKTLVLNGLLRLDKLPDYQYDFTLNAKDLKLVDATKGQNPLYYGEGYFDSQLKLKGKNLDFKLEGDVKINDKTNLTLTLEEESEAASELASIIEFVDFDAKIDTRKSQNVKKQSQINFANAVNLNIDVPQKATLNILMDPLTGDLLTVNGTGKFNLGFGNTGDLFMIGKYDINSGKYALTYQVIKKEFEITSYSNSNITWTGDPMKGDINITASYTVPRKVTPPFSVDEIEGQKLNELKLSVPVRIDLVLSGVIEKPEVNFEIAMFEKDLKGQAEQIQNQGYRVVTEKNEILQATASNYRKSEINKQAVILLLTGEFSPEKFFQNLEQASNYEDIARKKASELISSELNKYASGLIKGIDLNLGLESGYNANNNSRNTNLNLGLSKKLANDRLIISVGKNFELENKDLRSDEIFDNLQANWVISKDGRYRLNIFRKTQNDLVLEGAVIETGLGLIVAIDYETWKELLKRNKN